MSSTITDVARLAGVSPSTVSAVLNGKITVKDTTRQKILRAVAETNYIPNAVARGLRTKESKTIGLLLPTITNPYYPLIARGVEDEAHRKGYQVFLFNTERNEEKQLSYIIAAFSNNLDGLIFCNTMLTENELGLLHNSRIAVASMEPTSADWVDEVQVDYFGGTREMITYLFSIGHKRIALINGSTRAFGSQERLKGYFQAYEDAGFVIDSSLVFHTDYSSTAVMQIAEILLAPPMRSTCILAPGNMAMDVLRIVFDLGLRIPNDISLVSSDNCVTTFPPFTCIDYGGYMIGQQLAQMVISRRRSSRKLRKRSVVIPYSLSIGNSVQDLS